MAHRVHRLLQLAAAGVLVGLPSAPLAVAQGGTSAAERSDASVGLDEVLVTAQRREERLQDVPVSVTALVSSELAERQIRDVYALQTGAPNLAISQGLNDPTDLSIGIRGLSNFRAFIVVDQAVGLYVDGVYLARTAGANVGFIDMERVEVLRGPQGTLFGRNTIGGALSATTNKPVDWFEGSLALELGNYDERTLTAILNTPLVSERLAARLVYQYSEHSGYSQSSFLGQDLDDLLAQHYARGTLRFTPNDQWDVLLSADYMTFDAHTQLLKIAYANPAAATDTAIPAANGGAGDRISNYAGGDFQTNQTQFNPEITAEVWGSSATVTAGFGPATFRSISAYRSIENDRPGDDDGTPYPLIELREKPYRGHQVTQELHLFGRAFDERLDWITGYFYFDETGRQGQSLFAAVTPATAAVRRDDVQGDNRSNSVFTQLTYSILPSVRVTGGVRYVEDTRQAIYRDRLINPTTGAVVGCFMSAAIQDVPGVCQATSPEADFTYVPWTAGLDWKPNDDVLLYGKVSTGFRSGGFTQGAFGPAANPLQLQPFDTERVRSEEIGSKLQFFDRRLQLNAAIFDSTYEDVQIAQNLVVPGSPAPVAVIANLGRGRIRGGELETAAQLGALRLNAAWGRADSEYTGGPLVGLNFVDIPKDSVSAGASYRATTGLGALNVAASAGYRSKTWFINLPIAANAQQEEAFAQPGYTVVNATVSLEVGDTPFSVSLWGRNLTDEEYRTRTLDARALGIIPYTAGEPRTYGIGFTYSFGEEQADGAQP